MVLLCSTDLNRASDLSTNRDRAINIHATSNPEILLCNQCKDCQDIAMASIPFSAYSAGRIRETQRDMKMKTTIKAKEQTSKYFNTSFKEPSPLKYNSKLMNSIWGFYNRYSPHNVKKITDANSFPGEMQQTAAISSTKEQVLNISSATIDKVWTAINFSQSH